LETLSYDSCGCFIIRDSAAGAELATWPTRQRSQDLGNECNLLLGAYVWQVSSYLSLGIFHAETSICSLLIFPSIGCSNRELEKHVEINKIT